MVKILFFIILIAALAAGMYIYLRDPVVSAGKRRQRLFLAINAAMLMLMACGVLFLSTGAVFRVFEVFVLIFGFACGVQILWALSNLLASLFGRRKLWLSCAAAISAITAVLFIYGVTFGIGTVRVERVEVKSPRVSGDMDGLRIALFSDLHLGALLNERKLIDRVVDSINALNPDIVIQCGDIVNIRQDELTAEALASLSRIKSRYGVYFILGNHDIGVYITDTLRYDKQRNIEDIVRKQESMGWIPIDGRTLKVPVGEDGIAITGIPYPEELYTRSHGVLKEEYDYGWLYENVDDGIFDITVSHAPQPIVRMFGDSRPDLMVAGHLHSMQLKVTLGDWRWSPAALVSEYWSGLYEIENSRGGTQSLYVNDGLGYGLLPIRIGATPEITLIELRKCE